MLVPRAHDPSGLCQGSRVLARRDFLSMPRVFVSYCQPIRFARFDGKSLNRRLPVLEKPELSELSIPATGLKDRGLWGREWERGQLRDDRLRVNPKTLSQLLVLASLLGFFKGYSGFILPEKSTFPYSSSTRIENPSREGAGMAQW